MPTYFDKVKEPYTDEIFVDELVSWVQSLQDLGLWGRRKTILSKNFAPLHLDASISNDFWRREDNWGVSQHYNYRCRYVHIPKDEPSWNSEFFTSPPFIKNMSIVPLVKLEGG